MTEAGKERIATSVTSCRVNDYMSSDMCGDVAKDSEAKDTFGPCEGSRQSRGKAENPTIGRKLKNRKPAHFHHNRKKVRTLLNEKPSPRNASYQIAREKQISTIPKPPKKKMHQIMRYLKKSTNWGMMSDFNEDYGDTLSTAYSDSPVGELSESLLGKMKGASRLEKKLENIFKKTGARFDADVCPVNITPAAVAKDYAVLDNFVRRRVELENSITVHQQHLACLRWNIERREKIERKKRWQLVRYRRKLKKCREQILSVDASLSKERISNHAFMRKQNY